jgi:hypothetical protein
MTNKNQAAGRVRPVAYLLLATNLAYFSALKMEAFRSSETASHPTRS